MRGSVAIQPTLITALWPSLQGAGVLRSVFLVVLGSLLLTLSAKIQVPFWPVPMTMQTFAVLTLAMAFGPVLGTATVALYLLEGAFGLPVFASTPAKGIGIAYMVGPTGGYLAGMLAAAAVAGWLAKQGWDRSVARTALTMLLGSVTIYVPGLLWLATLVGLEQAVALGLTPFVLGEGLKIALAAFLLPVAWRLIGRKG